MLMERDMFPQKLTSLGGGILSAEETRFNPLLFMENPQKQSIIQKPDHVAVEYSTRNIINFKSNSEFACLIERAPQSTTVRFNKKKKI